MKHLILHRVAEDTTDQSHRTVSEPQSKYQCQDQAGATWGLRSESPALGPSLPPPDPRPSLGPLTTSSRKYHPSCQNALGSGCPPRRSRWPHRRGTGSCGPLPPASCPPGSPGVGGSGGKKRGCHGQPQAGQHEPRTPWPRKEEVL